MRYEGVCVCGKRQSKSGTIVLGNGQLYILLKPVTDGLKRLIEVFLEHIKEQGKKTISCMKGDSVSSACGSRFNPSDAITNSTSCCSQRYTYNSWKTCWTCIESTKS